MPSTVPEATKENTAIILVPGSFVPETFWRDLSRKLITDGYSSVKQCPLLSVSSKDDQRQPPAKIEDDALYIREVVQAYLNQGKDIVLVMCSYGGFPGTEAVKGLPSRATSNTDPLGDNRKGAVIGMIYFNSFIPFEGDCLRSMMGDYLFEPLKTGDPGKYMTLPAEAAPAIYTDLANEGRTEEMNYWFERMGMHSSDSYDGKVTHDLWADGVYDGKVVYILGESDMCVPPPLGESMIEKVEAKIGKDRMRAYRIPGGGHAMAVTRPDVGAQAIEDLLAA